MSTIRVLLADDHAVLRAGLKALLGLEPDLDVVGEAATGEEAVERARALRPDVVVMDLAMPGQGGLEATKQIAALGQGSRVLVLTSHAEEEYLLAVLEAGGSGYVQKTRADEDLINAIRVVARDEVFLYPSATKLLLKGYRTADQAGKNSPLAELSEREREVLAMIAAGRTNAEIADDLVISMATVKTHVRHIFAKLDLRDRAHAVVWAHDAGLRPRSEG